ncbi:Ulp1 protease family, carboxy-terminal domain protein [Senna tora]|uniref:Ulp1 protease family, carboxy-terminal domain protein n=1 Tax=Senna tora TaxID=362788 RepID=A0A834TQP4_9FABA|nr:Ulp1 protease family, carboxy-terminal domain protein [Senna tora]
MALRETVNIDSKVSSYGNFYMKVAKSALKIYIPMNDSNEHWYILVVKIPDKKLLHLDSLLRSHSTPCRHNQIRRMETTDFDRLQFALSLVTSKYYSILDEVDVDAKVVLDIA